MDHDVRLLFHELADLSPEDRKRVLAERRIAPEVRQEIESLLSFDSDDHQSLTVCVADAAGQVSIIADSLRFSGDLEGALQAIQEARQNIERAVFSGDTARRSNTLNVLWREGTILGQDGNISLDRPAQALAVLQKAFDLTEEWAQDPNNASSRILEADATREIGLILLHRDPRRALALYDLGLLRIREVPNNVSARHDETLLLAGSSYVLRLFNRTSEAKDRIDTAFRLLRETKDYPVDRIDPNGEVAMAMRALGNHLAETGQPQRAPEVYQELLDKITAYAPDPLRDLRHSTKLSRTYESLAALNRRTGHADAAAALDARRLELWKRWDSQLPKPLRASPARGSTSPVKMFQYSRFFRANSSFQSRFIHWRTE
jgi:tetratricopeptide (TPR) repeat protein